MAVNKKEIEEFEDMFDLSSIKNDDDNEQTEEYGHSTESTEPFDSLAQEMSEEIKKTENKGHSLEPENPHDIAREICSDGAASIPVQEKLEIVEEIPVVETCVEDDYDFFDDLPPREEPVVEPLESVEEDDDVDVDVEEEPVADAMFDDADIEPDDSTEEVVENNSHCEYGEVGNGDDKIDWMLESPSAMYNSFYQKKRDLLFKYMVGGQIEYKRWTQELEEAKVTIQGEVFDHQLIIDQMEAVQQHRERVKAIHVRVNNQYFTFKSFVEMMRGFLARVEYLKPVIKQEGLVMEHMRDVLLYYARLEALHDSATKTEKTLAAAFDTLSRKCTICMELKPAERVDLKTSSSSTYVPTQASPAREATDEFDEFDDLPSNAQAVPEHYKTGAISWGDI